MSTDLILAIGLCACVVNIAILIHRLNKLEDQVICAEGICHLLKTCIEQQQRTIEDYGCSIKSIDDHSSSNQADILSFMNEQNKVNKSQIGYNKSFARSIRGVANLAREKK